ncbi:DUF3616 domain-containing protein [Luteolibacter arcticus]|uniref:DUF3616 domain-containing protein n=1 Tax=Luteolibacter arcticus TaxID=1581411 RepID=A0ABT3GT42_9BACT|nr:DUF3616 domain-containing protein [Luteolibacter arcticus]MCW1926649.1 DUF3616 domain-containing protein [Luteolibacter arcticus]
MKSPGSRAPFLLLTLLPIAGLHAADQLAIWSFSSLSGLSSGSAVGATAEVLTGIPAVIIRNSDIHSSGATGVAYADLAGIAQPAGKAIGWSDFKKSGQAVDGQLDIAFNATGRSSLALRFDYKHSNDNDDAEKEMQWLYSTNGGSSWSSATKFTITDNNTWKTKSITLPAALNGQANVIVRLEKWAADSDSTEVNKSLILDNIELSAGGSTQPPGQTPVLAISSSSLSIPPTNPVSLCSARGDTADAALTAISISPSDGDTADANLTATVSSSHPAVATASLTPQTTGGQVTWALTLQPLGTGYTTLTVTVADPQGNNTTYVVNYAVSAPSSTPATSRYHAGASDASSAIALDADWMLVANDEDQTLRLYPRGQSDQPAKTFDLNANLGLAKEADFEATIRFGNRLYFLGSHGNDKEGNTEPTRNMCCSYDVSGTGAATALTYVNKFTGLKNNLISWDNANGHGLGAAALRLSASAQSGVLPTDPEGLNIEAATLRGSDVLLGFRAPLQNTSQRNRALVIPITNFRTVVDAGSGTMQFGAPVFLDLGGRAIRSMATLPSGAILILAGPVGESASLSPAFSFYRWDGNAASAPVRVSSSLDAAAANGGGSPEAIVDPPAELTPGSQVQVLQDNGTTVFYNDGIVGKDLATRAFAKSRSDLLTIGAERIVTTLVDENNVIPGTGSSLREVVNTAGFGDTITFAPALSGTTITLLHGPLALDGVGSISASALPGGITVSGNHASRVFDIAAGVPVSLAGLNLIDGTATGSGGILLNGGGDVSITGCTFAGGDAGTDGGAIAQSGGSLELANVTLSNNHAANRGGAIHLTGGSLVLDHVTAAGNSATVNGAGLSIVSGTAEVRNSILTGNTGPTQVAGAFTGSHNLTSGDPRLAPLASYGGATPVMPPLPGSPAIDAAGSSLLALDQRGLPRTLGGLPDAGACESFALLGLALTDSDHDGIDDRLEPALGLNVGTDDATRDSDGDGQTDAEEIADMTDPANPASRLAISGFVQVANEEGTGLPVYSFSFPTFPGLEYELETSTALDVFTPVDGSGFTATGYLKTVQVPLAAGKGFVRVVRK